MPENRAAELRRLLERIDERLIAALAGDGELDERQLSRVAVLETARGAVMRLLAEQGAAAP